MSSSGMSGPVPVAFQPGCQTGKSIAGKPALNIVVHAYCLQKVLLPDGVVRRFPKKHGKES